MDEEEEGEADEEGGGGGGDDGALVEEAELDGGQEPAQPAQHTHLEEGQERVLVRQLSAWTGVRRACQMRWGTRSCLEWRRRPRK